MKPGLAVGDRITLSVLVTEAMAPRVLQDAPERRDAPAAVIHPLYGTAAMVAHLEWAARQHILPFLEPGEEGVGGEIHLKHLHPAPIGVSVQLESVVTEVGAKRIVSAVRATCQGVPLGEGRFVQALVPQQELYQKARRLLSPVDTPLAESPLIETENSDDGLAAPSLVLASSDRTFHWELRLRDWEYQNTCTPYDEWIIVESTLTTPQGAAKIQGPFLLRMEMEQAVEGLQAVARGEQTRFASDFIEPDIQVIFERTARGVDCILTHGKQAPVSFTLDPALLSQWPDKVIASLQALQERL